MSGYYGFGNAGDEAVLAGIISSFAERCPKADIVVLSSNPPGTSSTHGVRAVQRMSPGEVLSTLRQSDLLISGGGSLLQDVTSARSLFYYLGIIWLAKRLGKKVMIYAQGIGPLIGKIARNATRSVLNKVDLITVRDESSKNYLLELGVNGPDIKVTADAAFALTPAPVEEADEIIKATGVPDDVPLIGISLRPWKDQVEWLPALARGLDAAAAQIGGALVFLPMQRDQDVSLCVQMASQMSAPSVVIPGNPTPRQMLAIIGRMSLVVGMRLHALVFSAAMGVPLVGVSYDPKVDAFVHAIDQDEPLKLEGLNSSDVTTRIIDIWNRRDDLTDRATKRIESLRESALMNADLACELVSNGQWAMGNGQ